MKKSLEHILRAETQKVTVTLSLALGAILIGFSLISSYQTNKQSCLLVNSISSKYLGPLARELSLGDQDTALSIFEKFQSELGKLGLKTKMKLALTPSDSENNVAVCEPGLLNSKVKMPVSFAGSEVAEVDGVISVPGGLGYLAISALMMLVIGLRLRFLLKKLDNELKRNIITPIRDMSKGKSIQSAFHYALEVSEIQSNFDSLKNRLIAEQNVRHLLLKDKELSDFARQVAHDIKSPLSALSSIETLDFDFSENKNMLMHAVNRIRSIASLLVDRYQNRTATEEMEDYLFYDVIENLVNEKKVQYPAIKFTLDATADLHFTAVKIGQTDLSRVISNILQNSIEALSSSRSPEVKISARASLGTLQLTIADNGVGIPQNMMDKILEEGIPFNKPQGQGLGLSQAKRAVESCGGRLSVKSGEGIGAKVTIDLPIATTPKWICTSINLKNEPRIIVVDDDLSIHKLWRNKLTGLPLETYYSLSQIEKVDFESAPTLLLLDFDLGKNIKTGLQFIKEKGFGKKAILVTSQFDKKEIQTEALLLGLKILPKHLITFVSVEKVSDSSDLDLVLIDDDDLVHSSWAFEAKRCRKKLKTFFDVNDLNDKQVSRDAAIFIDFQLGQSNGLEAAKIAFELGYKNIHIATGLEKSAFPALPPYIKSVTGKDFPTMFS